jgi:hypothetical protein
MVIALPSAHWAWRWGPDELPVDPTLPTMTEDDEEVEEDAGAAAVAPVRDFSPAIALIVGSINCL